MDGPLGYFKMTTLLALNLKKLSFFCSNFKYFCKWLAPKATRVAAMKVVVPKRPVPRLLPL